MTANALSLIWTEHNPHSEWFALGIAAWWELWSYMKRSLILSECFESFLLASRRAEWALFRYDARTLPWGLATSRSGVTQGGLRRPPAGLLCRVLTLDDNESPVWKESPKPPAPKSAAERGWILRKAASFWFLTSSLSSRLLLHLPYCIFLTSPSVNWLQPSPFLLLRSPARRSSYF